MARTTSLTKRSLINKANSTIVATTALAAFVVVFALVAGNSLVGQIAYQNRVINAKKQALNTLKADLQARDSLVESYKEFVADEVNVLGGVAKGTGERDGDNAKLVLDALPSKYDFPALTTSLEKIITDQHLGIVSIAGTDQEVDQAGNQTSPNPVPVAMPFQIQVNGSYTAIQGLVDMLYRSIRPFQIGTIELSGDENSMTAAISAQTYYQPEKSLDITQEVVR
jgi:Pilus assembly protein, PilO.